MPFDANTILAHAEELIRRMSPESRERARRARERRRARHLRVFRRMMIAMALILLCAAMFGWIVAPIGIGGLMAALALVVLAWVMIGVFSREPEVTPERMNECELPLLPQRTEQWLERQRPALPAPAARLMDGIGMKLDALTPQLRDIPAGDPAGAEVRKLLCEDLPGLVNGYQRVPPPLRRAGRDGAASPDAQLLDGLATIDGQIARLTEQLANDDLTRLATQNRYLELKYRGDEELK